MNSFDADTEDFAANYALSPSEVEERDAALAGKPDPLAVTDPADDEVDEDGNPVNVYAEVYGYDVTDFSISDEDMEWFLDKREDRDVWGE